jgi:hypothetical protein
MKNLAYLLVAVALINFSACKKSGTSPSKKNGSTTTSMHPVTSTIVQTGGVPATYIYTYDSDNNMSKMAIGNTYEVDITPHTVTQTSITSEFDITNTYSYSAGSNLPVDIYTTIPGQLSISSYSKDNLSGTSTTIPGYLWLMQAGKDNTIAQMGTSDNGGQTINFSYDANDNLKTIAWTALSGARASEVASTLTVTAVDDKHSPFSAVPGYNVFSYTQSMYPSDYALAFCKNNPTQMIYKQFDYGKGDLEINEQDDFTYTYNAQGYPLTVTVKVTYFDAAHTIINKSYTYTYK